MVKRLSGAGLTLVLLGSMASAGQPTKRPSDQERGEFLYRRHCMVCHGPANDGQGPLAAQLVAPIPSLIGTVEPTDDMAKVVLKGRGAMPGYEATFDKPDAIRVLKVMKQLTVETPLSETAGAAKSKGGSPVKNERLGPVPAKTEKK